MPVQCPECKNFMTNHDDHYECKRCGHMENKTKESDKTVSSEKTSTVMEFKDQYLQFINEIQHDTVNVIEKINLLYNTLGIKKSEYLDRAKIDEIKINEKTFQISMIHNINEFIRNSNNLYESLSELVSNIISDLQLEVDDYKNIAFTHSCATVDYLIAMLYQKLYNKDNPALSKEHKYKEEGLLETKLYELEEIQLNLKNTLHILKFI